MEKVKLTKAQAEAVEYFERVFVKNKESSMSNETLRKALNHGYEVLSEFKENDYVTNTETGITIKLDESKAYFLNNSYIHKDRIRHATPQEIKQEKERRWWKLHGRNPWELKERDVLTYKESDRTFNVDSVNGDTVVLENIKYGLKQIKQVFRVACFAEKRLDVSAE